MGEMPRHHVVIAGTGRAGTTFLVELLTVLGLETGFDRETMAEHKSKAAHAGLEWDIRNDAAPYVVKNPWFVQHADEVLSRPDIRIDRIFIPIRTVEDAAESRRRVERQALSQFNWKGRLGLRMGWIPPQEVPGGLIFTKSLRTGDQEEKLLESFYRLMLSASAHQVPVTLLQFPKMVYDADYLGAKLAPILDGCQRRRFSEAFAATARPRLVAGDQTSRP